MNRLHQFDKVEIVRIDKPGHSYESLNEMLDLIEARKVMHEAASSLLFSMAATPSAAD